MDAKIESEIMQTNPGVKFSDIIGMEEMKKILYEVIVVPVAIEGCPEKFVAGMNCIVAAPVDLVAIRGIIYAPYPHCRSCEGGNILFGVHMYVHIKIRITAKPFGASGNQRRISVAQI